MCRLLGPAWGDRCALDEAADRCGWWWVVAVAHWGSVPCAAATLVARPRWPRVVEPPQAGRLLSGEAHPCCRHRHRRRRRRHSQPRRGQRWWWGAPAVRARPPAPTRPQRHARWPTRRCRSRHLGSPAAHWTSSWPLSLPRSAPLALPSQAGQPHWSPARSRLASAAWCDAASRLACSPAQSHPSPCTAMSGSRCSSSAGYPPSAPPPPPLSPRPPAVELPPPPLPLPPPLRPSPSPAPACLALGQPRSAWHAPAPPTRTILRCSAAAAKPPRGPPRDRYIYHTAEVSATASQRHGLGAPQR
jgi:hypothetical protein